MRIQSDYIEYVPAKPEDVLAVLRDTHRHQCEIDLEADPDIELSFQSTINDWRNACDLMPWRKLGQAMNGWWDISSTDEEWRMVLEPAKEKSLEGVCRLIAEAAQIARLKPAHIAGKECLPAGAFLAVRDMLAAAGADVASIGPFTPLEPFAPKFLRNFIIASNLEPGRVPTVSVRESGHFHLSFLLFVLGVLCFGAGALCSVLLGSPYWSWLLGGGVMALLGYLATVWCSQLGFREVRFGNLVTFRDLAVRLAGQI